MFGGASNGNSSENYQAFAGFSGGGESKLSEQEITAGAIKMGSDTEMVQAMLSKASEGANDTQAAEVQKNSMTSTSFADTVVRSRR